MLLDLRQFADDDEWPRAAFVSHTEEKFAFSLDDSLQISGKIDRLDVAADGSAYVIDYKYSAAARTKGKIKNQNLVQAPLYLMAAEKHFSLKPAGMFYVGLKGEVLYVGWKNVASGDTPALTIDVPPKAILSHRTGSRTPPRAHSTSSRKFAAAASKSRLRTRTIAASATRETSAASRPLPMSQFP